MTHPCEMPPDGSYLAVTRMVLKSTSACSHTHGKQGRIADCRRCHGWEPPKPQYEQIGVRRTQGCRRRFDPDEFEVGTDDHDELTVPQMKQILRKLDLPLGGVKSALQKRLGTYIEEEGLGEVRIRSEKKKPKRQKTTKKRLKTGTEDRQAAQLTKENSARTLKQTWIHPLRKLVSIA